MSERRRRRSPSLSSSSSSSSSPSPPRRSTSPRRSRQDQSWNKDFKRGREGNRKRNRRFEEEDVSQYQYGKPAEEEPEEKKLEEVNKTIPSTHSSGRRR